MFFFKVKAFRNQKVKIERISVNFTLIWNVHKIDVTLKDFFQCMDENQIHRSTKTDAQPQTNIVGGTQDEVTDRRADPVELHYRFSFFLCKLSLSCKVYVCIWHSVHKVLRLFAGKWETNRYFTHTLGWIDTAAGG